MSEDINLLQQRVNSRRESLDKLATVVELAEQRVGSLTEVHDEADRERKRLKSSRKHARRRAERLAKETKRAGVLAREAREDLKDAENELDENLTRRAKPARRTTRSADTKTPARKSPMRHRPATAKSVSKRGT
jgi:chromosome segregation ATPase